MSKTIGLLLVLVALVAAVYFGVVKKPGTETATPATTEATTETPATTEGDMPPQPTGDEATQTEQPAAQPTEENPVVVETKTLDMPKAEEQPAEATDATATAAPAASDPTVDAMMADRTLGSPDAPIKVVEYSSLTCGHCAAFHNGELQKIKEAYIDTGKVQFIFKEYPLNEPAVVASQVLRCMPAEEFTNFMALLFQQQDKWAYEADYQNKLIQYAKLAGLGEEKAKACIANIDLKKRIVGDMQQGHDKYQIASTPTFIVNGGAKVVVGHQPFSFFQSTFDELLKK